MGRKSTGKGKQAANAGQRSAFGVAKVARRTKAAQAKRGLKAGGSPKKREIEQYDHDEAKRLNNPDVGLVNASTDPDKTPAKKSYAYDPHLDPQLHWAGKAEHTSFDVDSVSLHVHERIDPLTIVQAIKRKNGGPKQFALFERPSEKLGLRDAIDFYRHAHGWSNRLIAGDSLLVMNSLLEKEGLGGQVQMVYIDPPYGIKYGSNFQPFVNKRDVKDRKDEDLTQEPEMIRAFRDTWELGIHSYLTYLRDRLLLARQLLHESGSCFVQISDENLHHVRELMDEVFGPDNFCGVVGYRTTGGQSASLLSVSFDYLVWYAKRKEDARKRFRQPRQKKKAGLGGSGQYTLVEPRDGSAPPRPMTDEEVANPDAIGDTLRVLAHDTVFSQGAPSDPEERHFEWNGVRYECPANSHWKPGVKSGGMQRLADADRLMLVGNTVRYKRYLDDYPVVEFDNVWNDTAISGFGRKKQYVVETAAKVVERCILMTTDPGDLVLDPTCGSGTTAHMAEKCGRRWITCDSSRVAVALAKQRLMTADFDFFELAHEQQGVAGGFEYETVQHVMLGAIANNPEIKPGMTREQIDAAIARHAEQETLYDQPKVDKTKVRVTGPFTVEAVPAPAAIAPDELARGGKKLVNLDGKKTLPGMEDPQAKNLIGFTEVVADASVARSGETLRQQEWRDELLKCGIRAKGGAMLHFSRVEPLAGTRWLHAEAETRGAGDAAPKKDTGKVAGANTRKLTAASVGAQRVVISFGPEHAPLEQRQVEKAIDEAYNLKPRPQIVLFASFQFDPEAAKDIDELKAEKIGMQVLKVQMNTDLLTDDLKKKRSSNESFWLVGQPDVTVRKLSKDEIKAQKALLEKQLPNDEKRRKTEQAALEGMYIVEVAGFDYYDPRTGKVDGGGADKIAMWMLDTDYDGRSLYPRQVFFPMAGKEEAWAKLAKSLKAELDDDLIEQYRGTVSLPFALGKERTIAVKIIDDRGIESLRVMEVG
ncbi:MAG: site-specific DNA-methyltransferase [Planctomycetes bacterium]|nr:site-specific DNA-methyltransferase [Planctomycetota bacterium]